MTSPPDETAEPPKSPPSDLQYRIRVAELRGTVALAAIRYGGVVACFYFIFRSIESLAGRHTWADILLVGNVQISAVVSWAVGAGGVAYGWRQRGLRHNVNAQLGARVSMLEKKLDPKRSSSTLTNRGQTNPEDVL